MSTLELKEVEKKILAWDGMAGKQQSQTLETIDHNVCLKEE